jgi:thioredoxin-like negative regulator of GroEL
MTYEELLAGGQSHLVMFYGTACGPCARLKPRLAALAARNEVSYHQINVASDMDAVRALKLRSVPSLVLVRAGRGEHVHTGDATDEQIEQILREKAFLT